MKDYWEGELDRALEAQKPRAQFVSAVKTLAVVIPVACVLVYLCTRLAAAVALRWPL